MEPWHIWIIVAVVLFVAEILTPGFVLAAFGVGCLASALASLAGLGLAWQLLVFSIGTLGSFVGIRPFVLRKLHPGDRGYQSGVEGLVGKDARVLERVDPAADTGRVMVGGEDWRAVSGIGQPIEAGSLVTVVGVDGAKLIVVPEALEEG